MSKIEQARNVYNANAGKARKEIIAAIQENMKISEVSAATYYATLKRQEKDAAAAGTPKVDRPYASPESWAKVGEILKEAEQTTASEQPKAVTPQKTYTPTKQRVAQPSTRKGALERFHDTLDTPEKVAEWQAELKAMIESGEKPLFGK